MLRSKASNITWTDRSGQADLFLTNVDTGKTHLVSVGPSGEQYKRREPGESGSVYFSDVSDNGRYVLFIFEGTSAAFPGSPGESRLFLWDRTTKTTTWIHDDSFKNPFFDAVISGDGSLVAFRNAFSSTSEGIKIFTYSPATGEFGPPIEPIELEGYDSSIYSPLLSDDGTTLAYRLHRCDDDHGDGVSTCFINSILHDLTTGERVEIEHLVQALSGDGNYALTFDPNTLRFQLLGPLREPAETD